MESTNLKLPKEKPSQTATLFVIFLMVAIFILAFVVWPNWYDSKHPQPNNDCRNTSKKVQTITKVDGGVESVQTETVYGCEYSDGTFIPAPDAQ